MAAAKRKAPELYTGQRPTRPFPAPVFVGQKWIPSGDRTTSVLTPAIVGPLHGSKYMHAIVDTKE